MDKYKTSDLTFLIPCYNAEDTIHDCLASLTQWLEVGVNVVVTDNCSTDGSLKIINNFFNNTTYSHKIFSHDANIGALMNMKFLLENCTSDLALIVGSDDRIGNLDLEFIFEQMVKQDVIAVSLKTYFENGNNMVPDKCNRAIFGAKKSRLSTMLLHPGANSRFYSVMYPQMLAEVFPTVEYWGWDMVVSANVCLAGNWPYSEESNLIRQAGTSADPFKLRKGYGFSGLKLIFPSRNFVNNILMLISQRDLFNIFAINLLYLRYVISPIKHYYNKFWGSELE